MYFINLVHAIFNVLTDSMHKTGFKLHCKILQHLIHIASVATEHGKVISSTQDPSKRADIFLQEHLTKQLSAFQNLNQQQVC